MKKFLKPSLILAGYAAALLVTWATFSIYSSMRKEIDPGSGGMQAFGDLILCVGLFAFLALIPTVFALYWLRAANKFWIVFSIGSVALAAFGAVAALLLGRSPYSPWAALVIGLFGLLKVMGAPLFALAFAIFAAIAPVGRPRKLLLAAAGIECTVSAYAGWCLLFLKHWPRWA